MIRLILELPDESYENLRDGISFGFFKFSLDDLKQFDVKIIDVIHIGDI